MHFASALVAAGALALFGAASAAAVAIPAELLEPRLADDNDSAGLSPRNGEEVSFKLFAHTSCSFKGGPDRGLAKNTCFPLSPDSHGLKITNHVAGCWLVRYQDGNCGGTGQYTMDQIGECYDVGDDWGSIKAFCK